MGVYYCADRKGFALSQMLWKIHASHFFSKAHNTFSETGCSLLKEIGNHLACMNLKNRIQLLPLPVYPLLFSIFPVLFLWNANRAQEPAYVVIPSLVITLAITAFFYLLFAAILRNVQRAALLTCALAFVLLSYGHLENLIAESIFKSITLPIFLPSLLLVELFVLILIILQQAGNAQLTHILNVISAGLVILQVATATPYYLTVSAKANAADEISVPTVLKDNGVDNPRDIYFILLDNYGREDVLRKVDNFDNSELVNALKERGFIFPGCAQANYFATAPVISSILNMDYLDQMGIEDSVYTKRSGYTALAPYMQDSLVMRKFQAFGYHTVTFRGFMGLIDIQSSDTYINYESDESYNSRLETKNFNALYLETTMLSPINNQLKIYPDWLESKGPAFLKPLLPEKLPVEERYYQVYQQNLYAYEALERIPTEIKGPKFVYAHIYSAHWPFMIQPDGSLRLPFTDKMTVDGYVAALKFTNNRILKAIDTILANSETPPIIILQGDHNNLWEGKVEWSGTDRMKILSAYYLPGGGDQLLYKEISPVNNFRLIFNYYFGEPVNLLPDVSHYLDNKTKTVKIAPNTCISQATTSTDTK